MDNSKIEHTYFHSLEIEGIGCFKDKQTLDLSNGANNYAPWTLILGDNGTGKTTLLKIIDRMQPLVWYAPESNENSKKYLPAIVNRNLEFWSGDFKPNIFIDIKITNSKDSQILKFNTQNNKKSPTFPTYRDSMTEIFVLSYGASRRLSKINNLSSSNQHKITTLFDDSLELINAEEWYFQKYLNQTNSDKNVANIFAYQLKSIKKLLVDFLPDISDIRPKEINNVKETSSLEVKLESGEWIALRELSYGYQTMTALLVDIGSRMMEKYPESDNPLAEPVIILIDEIDLHLHPKWQRQIMEQFSKYFPKAQFIVTSHSPLIVQAAKGMNANIVVCRKDGDKVFIDNNPEEVKGWRIDQILISDLFDLPTVRSNADEEKMSRYYELQAKSERTIQEESELGDIQKVLKTSFENEREISETERKINQFLETHLK
ncbi:MAG: AAA family ATPase [Chitinophagales bacterium]|jgi:predicted ATP-binding protein involved in virulence|nr:AAA family ATPase [Sphingobacteriales bacterium]